MHRMPAEMVRYIGSLQNPLPDIAYSEYSRLHAEFERVNAELGALQHRVFAVVQAHPELAAEFAKS